MKGQQTMSGNTQKNIPYSTTAPNSRDKMPFHCIKSNLHGCEDDHLMSQNHAARAQVQHLWTQIILPDEL